jgi:D-alanyl-D-alanine dipeptidase
MAHTQSNLVSQEVLKRRQEFVDLMSKHNFRNYDKEWWHFTLINEPYPDTYFDFDITEQLGENN